MSEITSLNPIQGTHKWNQTAGNFHWAAIENAGHLANSVCGYVNVKLLQAREHPFQNAELDILLTRTCLLLQVLLDREPYNTTISDYNLKNL